MIDIDLMAYRMIQDARSFDVIAAPNLFGDVLADLGAVLLGSRGLSFSGNFSTDGKAVFQTNHGAAYDLGCAPIEPIPSAGILAGDVAARGFGLAIEPDAIEEAARMVGREGWRTEDVAADGCQIVGTRAMSRLLAKRAGEIARGLLRSDAYRSRVA